MLHLMIESDTQAKAREVQAVLALRIAPDDGGFGRNIISVLSGVCSGVSSAGVVGGCLSE